MVSLTISTSLSGYDGRNELVGQIKDLIVNNAPSGVVTVVSDNNPAPGSGTSRVVLLQIGNSQHYLRLLAATSGSSVTMQFRNIAGSSYLGDPLTLSNGSTVYLIAGLNVLVLRGSVDFILYFKDSAGNWWGRRGPSYVFYPYNSDTSYTFIVGSVYRRLPDGRVALLPARQLDAEIYANCLFGYNNQDSLATGTIVQDGTGVYYMVVYTATSSVNIGPYSIYPALLAQEG